MNEAGNCQAVVEIIDGKPYTCPNLAVSDEKCDAHADVDVTDTSPDAVAENDRILMSCL